MFLTAGARCRYDILLQANQPVGNYWIIVMAVNSTRTGSPAGYGVLRYASANQTLPSDPILQPESLPAWSFGTVSAVRSPTCYRCDLLPKWSVLFSKPQDSLTVSGLVHTAPTVACKHGRCPEMHVCLSDHST